MFFGVVQYKATVTSSLGAARDIALAIAQRSTLPNLAKPLSLRPLNSDLPKSRNQSGLGSSSPSLPSRFSLEAITKTEDEGTRVSLL